MARAERITLQEASELSGVSIPTIYRRIRSGELRGAICIDASGKHWELFKSDLPKLTLKRRKRSTEALPAVQVADNDIDLVSAESVIQTTELPAKKETIIDSAPLANFQAADSAADSIANETKLLAEQHKLLVENEVLKARCADLEENLKHSREELDSAKDEASYWRGRWEEISLNFEALRKMFEDRNNEDQELIWDLRGQVADLQDEHSESDQVSQADESEEYVAPVAENEVEEDVQAQQVQLDSFPTAVYQVSEDVPRTTAEIIYNPNITNIDKAVNFASEAEGHEEIYPEPDFGDISSSSLTSADDIDPVAAYADLAPDIAAEDLAAKEAVSDSEKAEKEENSLPTDNGEQAEEENETHISSGSKLSPFPIARNVKFSMRHPKGRQGKRGRKRIPPLR